MAVEIFPVVHVNDISQAVEQSGMAFEMGANGVYLIDHHNSFSPEPLKTAFNKVATQYPDSFIGLNLLQHRSAARSLAFLHSRLHSGSLTRLPDGLWADVADREKQEFLDMRHEFDELANIRYLGGVAFKYTSTFTDDPERAAAEATRLAPFVDVVTTSGQETGMAPSSEKIQAMKAAIGSKPLAVASGISADNLADYNGNIDQLLVSSSIETRPYSGVFDPTKLRELIDVAHAS